MTKFITKIPYTFRNNHTMSSNSIIEAIRRTDNLATISTFANMEKSEFKEILIQLIEMNPGVFDVKRDHVQEESFVESKPSTKCDDELDEFEIVIKNSKVPFSDEQIEFMNLAVNHRRNLALLSPAGFGKSAVIETTVRLFQTLISPHSEEWIKENYGQFEDPSRYLDLPVVGLCASTGKAASLIKGKTFHSYMGIGLGRGTVDDWVKRITTVKYLKTTLYSLRVVQAIIIDEISMISSKMLDDISEYLKKIRKNKLPFGGIQMILVGDFAQLPPVHGTFAFNSVEYKLADIKPFKLTKCFRQTDTVFLDILNNLRNGTCTPEDLAILKSCKSIDPKVSRGMKPMRLLSTNNEVDIVNSRELVKSCEENNSEVVSFKVKIVSDKKKAESCMKADMIPEEVHIAVGAQIVVTHNLSNGAVNGTQGKVIQIRPNEVVIESSDDRVYVIGYIGFKDPDSTDVFSANVIFSYMPLRLGWACTVHKSQGMTLSLLEVDLKRAFAHGQTYVAISRVRSLGGLVVKNITNKAIICDPSVKAFMDTM